MHQNIAGFGGDPAKVTIFGQSSGGVAADWWTFAYKDKPIVNGIISESGNAFSFPLNSRELQTRNWYNVSATLGCGSEGDTLDCVRGKEWRDVLAAAAKLPAAPGGNPVRSTPAFYPTVDNETVFSGYASLLGKGEFAKIVSHPLSIHPTIHPKQPSLTTHPLPQPQLLGNNHNEQGYYIIPAYGRGINTTLAQQSQFLLESFTCPNAFEARARAAHGVPVWLYRYFGDWPNTQLYPTSGAYHGTEMQMLFGMQSAFLTPTPSWNRRYVGAHTTKFNATSHPKEMTRGPLGKWRLSGSWPATVWHKDGYDAPEYIHIKGLTLPLIFTCVRWQ